MHFDSTRRVAEDDHDTPWYRGLTKYHWFVLVVAALGWMFDTMDQQLFNLARKPAMVALLHTDTYSDKDAAGEAVSSYGGYATAIFMIGWALGGLGFGILGDRIGRAKTMMMTILIYSLFTGLSAFSTGFADFAFYRFLTGLGVGGEFAVGVALVAEVFPDRSRPHALGWLQASSALGNMTAAVIAMVLGNLERTGSIASSWRAMFIIGTLPALLAILIRRNLKEPEKWKAAAKAEEIPGSNKQLGSVRELFGDPRWRRNAIVGMVLGFSGVVGLWGIGFFSFDLVRAVYTQQLEAQVPKLSAEAIAGELTWRVGLTSLFQNLGGFFGVYAFTKVTTRIGRRLAFAISFLLAAGATAWTFWSINEYHHIFWMIPIMGFCQLTLFGGYAIYFPELFPTRLRSTGTSFCYNVGRLVAAVGPLTLGGLTSALIPTLGEVGARRYAGVAMCSVFVIGLFALPFAPETKGKPLPE